MTTKSQTELILEYLQEGNSISPLEALQKFGCFRLGARCWDLRKQGFNIVTTMITQDEKHFASYKLIIEPQQTKLF